MNFHDDMPLGEARDGLRALAHEGARCPCCRQNVKVYKRSIHTAMASGLIKIWRAAGREWTSVPDKLTHRENADFAKLAYWGLVESEIATREDGSPRTGRWRLTALGVLFVKGESAVPKYAEVYDGNLLRLSGDLVRIYDGKRFDYGKLMRGE